jgi:hypothetical protein
VSLIAVLWLAVAGSAPPVDAPEPQPSPSDVEALYGRLFPGSVVDEPPSNDGSGEKQPGSEGELSLGPLRLRPSLTLGYVDGDNLFVDSAQPTRDRYFLVQPSLGVRLDALNIAGGMLRLSYEPRFRVGSSFEDVLRPSHELNAVLELPLTPGLKLLAGDHYFIGTVETTEADPGREYFFGLGHFTRNQVDAGLRLETGGRLELELGGSLNQVAFDEETSFFDYDRQRGTAAVRYELSPGTRLGLVAALERVPGTDARPESRSRATSYGMALDGSLAPLTTGKIEVGYRDESNPDAAPGGTRYRGLYANASVSKEFSRGARLSVGASRSTPLSAFEQNGFYVSTDTLAAVTFSLPLRIAGSCGASYQWNSYQTLDSEIGAPRRDHIFGWSAGLGRALTRWAFLRADYRRDRRDSNLQRFENTADGFVIQLGVGWFQGDGR